MPDVTPVGRLPRADRPDRYRRLNRDRFDVVVVGAGAGGLTAAALLAQRGRRVLVVDPHYVAGGNATVFRRRQFTYDVGLHYVGDCHPDGMIPRILRACGVDQITFREMDPDGYDTLVFDQFRFRYPKGREAFRRRLIEAFPAERRGIERYIRFLGQLQRMIDLAGKPPWAALWTLPRAPMVLRWAHATFAQFLDTCSDDPRLRAVLAGQSGDYALPPSRVSVLAAAGLTLHYLHGAYFPEGGGQVISDGLADAIERRGGKILLLTRAQRIIVDRGRVQGVVIESKHLGCRRIEAPVVISNADLKHTMRDLVGWKVLPPALEKRVESYQMSPALGIVYLIIKRDLLAEGHPCTNYWIHPDLDTEPVYAAAAAGTFHPRPLCFVSIASLKDPTNPAAAQPGLTNLQLMAPAPSAPVAWGTTEAAFRDGSYRASSSYRRLKAEFANQLVAVAERALPGLSQQIVQQEVATPLTHRRFTGATGGTSYGIALTPDQFLSARPASRTAIQGLYLCGASTRSGHGIAGVLLSGLNAAAEVTDRAFVRQVLSGVTKP